MNKLFIILSCLLLMFSLSVYALDDDEYSYIDNYYEEYKVGDYVQVKYNKENEKETKIEETSEYNLDIKNQVSFEFKSSRVTTT